MKSFGWIEVALEALGAEGLARDPRDFALRTVVEGAARGLEVPFVDASSNDYLGYAARGLIREFGDEERGIGWDGREEVGWVEGGAEAHLVSRETLCSLDSRTASSGTQAHQQDSGHTMLDCLSPGSGASRLLGGTRSAHEELERQLARWVGHEESLLFSSGYAANVGLLSCLAQDGDVVFSDELNHASIIDGCRLSPAGVRVYRHLDITGLRTLIRQTACSGRRFIVSETYFSMDADTPDLPLLRAIADEYDAALILDEAHALGVFGPRGSGLSAGAKTRADITVGTLGKAVGLQGAFVAAPKPLRAWLWNRARSFVYSTAPSPALARQTLLHVEQIQRNGAARACLRERSARLRQAVIDLGLPLSPGSHGPIVPIILGETTRAVRIADELRARGILAYPIRPPTVPQGTARIRLTITAAMSELAFDHLLDSLRQCLGR